MSHYLQRHAANTITMVRIVAAPLAFVFRDNTEVFLLLWTLCALSDALDGTVARALGTASDDGARLDTIADLVSYLILVLIILGMVDELPLLPYGIAIVAVVRVGNLAICARRFHILGGIHTWGNKITGLLFFMIPFYVALLPHGLAAWVLFLFALLTALEEGAILLVSRSLDLECPSLWHALREREASEQKIEPNVA